MRACNIIAVPRLGSDYLVSTEFNKEQQRPLRNSALDLWYPRVLSLVNSSGSGSGVGKGSPTCLAETGPNIVCYPYTYLLFGLYLRLFHPKQWDCVRPRRDET